MIHKTSTFRRMMNRNHSARRTHIGVNCLHWDKLKTDKKAQGKLRDGKIHCSCPWCTNKSTKYINKSINSISKYSTSDKRKFNSLESSYDEYMSA